MACVFSVDNFCSVSWDKAFFIELKIRGLRLKYDHICPTFKIRDGYVAHIRLNASDDGSFYLLLKSIEGVIEGNYASVVRDGTGSVVHKEVGWINSGNKNLLKNTSFKLKSIDKTEIVLNSFVQLTNTSLEKEKPEIDSGLLSNRLKELSLDFKKIMQQEDNDPDITLNVGKDSIRAHKVVLRARSSVFDKMFSHDSLETVESTVEIKDISLAAIKNLISYLYTGTAEKCATKSTMELYYAADKYEILSLREDCKMELLKQLCVDNACSLFSLASRHSDQSMKEEVELFIRDNIKSVVETESFKGLSKEDVMHLMYLGICNLTE